MKLVLLLLVVFALAAGAWYFSVSTPVAPVSSLDPAAAPEAYWEPPPVPDPRPVALPGPVGAETLLRQFEKILARLEHLEGSVSEVRTEISIRTQERSRVAVPLSDSSAGSRLDDDAIDTLRKLIREGLVNESWRQRQSELANVGRHLAIQLELEAKYIDPMIEILCTNGLTQFNLERELAEQNYDRSVAKRRAPDFRLARRRLRDDLGALFRNDELAARIFLHAASGGEVAALRMGRDRLLAVEKDWLR